MVPDNMVPDWFCAHHRHNGENIGPLQNLPPHLQIVLLDFAHQGWPRVNRVSVKTDLLKNAATKSSPVTVRSTVQEAIITYLTHFRQMATDGTANKPHENYISLWVGAYNLESNRHEPLVVGERAAPAEDAQANMTSQPEEHAGIGSG